MADRIKFCVNCAHVIKPPYGSEVCGAIEGAVDLVTGENYQRACSLERHRDSRGPCGEAGRLWKPRTGQTMGDALNALLREAP